MMRSRVERIDCPRILSPRTRGEEESRLRTDDSFGSGMMRASHGRHDDRIVR